MLTEGSAVLEKRDSTLRRPKLTVLQSSALDQCCRRTRFCVSPDLVPFLVRAWTLEWHVEQGRVFEQRVVADPCAHIAIDEQGAWLLGVVTGAFVHAFTGEGFVFGLKFQPAGLHPFAGHSMSRYRDVKVPLRQVLPSADEDCLLKLAAARDGEQLLRSLEATLRQIEPHTGERWRQVVAVTEAITSNASLLTVEQVAERFDMHPRMLQRLFREYTGVTPKWMIRRCRMQEAAARVESGGVVDWAALALELGYFDQAHFVRDFSRLIGDSPARYARRIGL